MEPFIGEIVLFGGNFAPKGWSFCNGQLLSIEVNAPLYSILGTNFGGDGVSTFGLPDLRGRVPVHPGHGVGLSKRTLGETGGSESIELQITEIPEHNHVVSSTINMPIIYEKPSTKGNIDYMISRKEPPDAGTSQSTQPHLVSTSLYHTENIGNNMPHNNMQPYQCINYIIALHGIYPART